MDNVNCIGCGKCCNKHWLVKLTTNQEKQQFAEHIVFGEFMWTDLCPYLKDNKCTIQNNKPRKCSEYFCEKYFK
jgi:Fe-S-cluster containining protein